MIRSVNDQFGFADRYTTNELIMDWERYPVQNTDAIGKYISLNIFCERGRFMRYRIRIRKDLKEEYSDLISDNYEQTVQEMFRILRYDLEEPFKVILVSLSGQVIVTTKDRIDNLVYINDEMCTRTREYITNILGEDYYEPTNVVDNYEDFFNEFFNKEAIEVFPVQNQKMLLRPVYIEFQSDIPAYDISYNEGPEKNNHAFTKKIKESMIERNPKLFGLTDREIDSYPYIHDIHGESYVDDPRRTKKSRGYIIRADQNANEQGQIVVMYQLGDVGNSYRVITLDEARFYYITNVEERTKDVDEREVYTALYNYIVYGDQYVPEEKIIIDPITDEQDARDEDAWELTDLDCGYEDNIPDDDVSFDFGFGFEEDQSFLWDFDNPEFDFNLEPAVLQDNDIMNLEIWDFDRLKDEPDDVTWDFDTSILVVDQDPSVEIYDFFYDPLVLEDTDLIFDFSEGFYEPPLIIWDFEFVDPEDYEENDPNSIVVWDFDLSEPMDDEYDPDTWDFDHEEVMICTDAVVYDFEILSEAYMDPANAIGPNTEIWDFTSDSLFQQPEDIVYDFYRDFELDDEGLPIYPPDWKDEDPPTPEENTIDFGYDIIINPDEYVQIWDYSADEEEDDETTWDFNIEDDDYIWIYDCNE